VIRRLGDVAADSVRSASFVRVLLLHHSAGGPVTRNTWRAAQRHWEDTVEAFLHVDELPMREAERRTINTPLRLIAVDELMDYGPAVATGSPESGSAPG
jgi:hypothetical protein